MRMNIASENWQAVQESRRTHGGAGTPWVVGPKMRVVFLTDLLRFEHDETSVPLTLEAETYQMELGLKSVDRRIRAAGAKVIVPLSLRSWRVVSDSAIQRAWTTDCASARNVVVP